MLGEGGGDVRSTSREVLKTRKWWYDLVFRGELFAELLLPCLTLNIIQKLRREKLATVIDQSVN